MYCLKSRNPRSKRRLARPPQDAPAASDSMEHILIVDDEKSIVQIGQEILETLGYQVTGRTNSMEALETVRQRPEGFDLVITDFIMPRMNGIELARELSRLRPGMPIILYTAIDQAISQENGKKIGIEAYLMKPVKAAELYQTIRRVLRRSSKAPQKKNNPDSG